MPQDVLRKITRNIVYADDWRLVQQSTPNTVPAKKSSGTIVSESLGNFSNPNITPNPGFLGNRGFDNLAGSNGTKFIIHWKKPTKSTHFYRFFTATKKTIAYRNCIGMEGFTAQTTMIVRARTIINDFDPNTVTWNNTVVTPTLTYGNSTTKTSGTGSMVQGLPIVARFTNCSHVSQEEHENCFLFLSGVGIAYGLIIDISAEILISGLFGTGPGFLSGSATYNIDLSEYPYKPFYVGFN